MNASEATSIDDILDYALSDNTVTDVPDIVDWAEEHFYVIETKRPIMLQPVQKAVLRAFFERTPAGKFKYRTGLYSTIKKSGKTTIAALVQQWACEHWGDYGEIYHMGNKLSQAKERAFKMTRYSIELSPTAGDWEITATQLTHLPTRSFIKALPNSAAGEAGGNQRLTTWTEFHGYIYEEDRRFWSELQPVPTQPLSFRFVESYAGYEGESDLLKSLWDRAIRSPRIHDEFPIYADEENGLIAYIDTGEEARRMPWQTPEYYKQAEAEELPHEFRRIHLNLWVNSVNALFDIALWDRLKYTNPPEYRDVVVACDASVSGDCTALVVVTYLPDSAPAEGEDALSGDVVEIESHVWTPPQGGKLDYDTTIKAALHSVFERYRVVQVAYDPYQLHDVMTGMGKKYGASRFYAFPQGGERIEADTRLVTRIRQGRMQHTGNPEIRAHFQNADGKASGDKALRIVKRHQNKPIDLAVAISMAAAQAEKLLRTPAMQYPVFANW